MRPMRVKQTYDYDVFFDNGRVERVEEVENESVAVMSALYRWATGHMFEPEPVVVEVRELVRVRV
jgi:hypothetical protein